MSSTARQGVIFASAILISAVTASEDVSRSISSSRLQQLFQNKNKEIPHERRFNVAQLLESTIVDEQANEAYWQEAEHEYEPPVHNPKEHKPMPTSQTVTVYDHDLIDTRAHPSESPDRTETIPAQNNDQPSNYFYEHPVKHHAPVGEHHELVMTDSESMAHALQQELAKRHLGHKYVKQPIYTKQSLSGVKDQQKNTKTESKVIETIYDDLSIDRMLHQKQTDHIVDTNVTLLPDEDGILKTFIERYTTMLVHDSIFMEELPTPQFMHQEFSVLHPLVQGALRHDPRYDGHVEKKHHYQPHSYQNEYHEGEVGELEVNLTLNDLLNDLNEERYGHEERTYDNEHEDLQHSNNLQDLVAKEGGHNFSQTLGLHLRDSFHIKDDGEMQASPHHESVHPVDLHGWDLKAHLDDRDLNPHQNEDAIQAAHLYESHIRGDVKYNTHGIPIHNVEHADQHSQAHRKPYHSEFHGLPTEHRNQASSNNLVPANPIKYLNEQKLSSNGLLNFLPKSSPAPLSLDHVDHANGSSSSDEGSSSYEWVYYDVEECKSSCSSSDENAALDHQNGRFGTGDWDYYDETDASLEDEDYDDELDFYDYPDFEEETFGYPDKTYKTLQKQPQSTGNSKSTAEIPHGTYLPDPLHFGHSHEDTSMKEQTGKMSEKPREQQKQSKEVYTAQKDPSLVSKEQKPAKSDKNSKKYKDKKTKTSKPAQRQGQKQDSLHPINSYPGYYSQQQWQQQQQNPYYGQPVGMIKQPYGQAPYYQQPRQAYSPQMQYYPDPSYNPNYHFATPQIMSHLQVPEGYKLVPIDDNSETKSVSTQKQQSLPIITSTPQSTTEENPHSAQPEEVFTSPTYHDMQIEKNQPKKEDQITSRPQQDQKVDEKPQQSEQTTTSKKPVPETKPAPETKTQKPQTTASVQQQYEQIASDSIRQDPVSLYQQQYVMTREGEQVPASLSALIDVEKDSSMPQQQPMTGYGGQMQQPQMIQPYGPQPSIGQQYMPMQPYQQQPQGYQMVIPGAQQQYYGAQQSYGYQQMSQAGEKPGKDASKKHKLSYEDKQKQKALEQRAGKKQKDQDLGVRSFDSFFNESGQYNEASTDQVEDGINEEDLPQDLIYDQSIDLVQPVEEDSDDGEVQDEGDLWDDNYDWTKTALNHDGYGMKDHEVPNLKELLTERENLHYGGQQQPQHQAGVTEAEQAVQAYLAQVQEQAMHDLVPLISRVEQERHDIVEIPELDFDDSDDERKNNMDGPSTSYNPEHHDIEDAIEDPILDSFDEQNFMDNVIRMVI